MLRQPNFKQNPCKPLVFFILGLILCLINATAFSNPNDGWKTLTKGIDYQDLAESFLTPWSHIHAFRIDLSDYQFSLITAHALSTNLASADEFAERSDALITLNGGFFDKTFNSLGLRIANYKTLSPLKHISWWGVFYIKDNRPYLTTANQFSPNRNISFAIQSGPRLIINTHIPPLKPGRAQRSALGITNDNKVIVLVTDNSPLSTLELANIMKSAPLNCVNALNLDGGSSTQLNAKLPSFQLMVHGFANVSDAITIKRRQ